VRTRVPRGERPARGWSPAGSHLQVTGAANQVKRRRTARGLGSLEQFEHVAPPMPSDLLAVASLEDDDLFRVAARLSAPLADRQFALAAHARIIGISASPLEEAETAHRRLGVRAGVRRALALEKRMPHRWRLSRQTSS
jgi:hypothetical protein